MSEIERAEKEGRSVLIPSDDWESRPPLMLIFNIILPTKVIDHIRQSFDSAMRERKPMLVEKGISVYQLIRGEWRKLD